MIISPKVRGFICTASHPVGCRRSVEQQIEYVKSQPKFNGPKNVLVIGASTGYGLASRIAATFGSSAKTIGVFYERPATEKRTASAGWYNTAAFEEFANEGGYYARSVNGDAFSNEIKQQTADIIEQDLGQVDLIIYSLASPRRDHPVSGERYSSALKTIGEPFTNKTIDTMTGEIKEVTIGPATQEEIDNTIAVMGGEDWQMWIDYLQQRNLIADNAMTVAYSYIGPELTFPVYRDGTIGQAKKHLEDSATALTEKLSGIGGKAFVSVNKALVTQSSAAIPIVPLYISILFKVMIEKGLHEKCIEQMYRLFHDRLYIDGEVPVDEHKLIRVDDYEMRDDVQQEVYEKWTNVNSDNIHDFSALDEYQRDFYQLFGFEFDDVDYLADVDPNVEIPSLETSTSS